MKRQGVVILLISFLLSVPAFSDGQTLTEQSIPKLKRIAEILASQITAGKTAECKACHTDMAIPEKTVAVEDFNDLTGKPGEDGRQMADEFKRQLSSIGANLKVVDTGADIVVTGTLTPFKGREKWKLSIKAASSDGRVITVYDGILKKPKKTDK